MLRRVVCKHGPNNEVRESSSISLLDETNKERVVVNQHVPIAFIVLQYIFRVLTFGETLTHACVPR